MPPIVEGPDPWAAPENLPSAIVVADGHPLFYSGDRLVGEMRASALVTYQYDDRGLLIGEVHESRTRMEVAFTYDEDDRLVNKQSTSYYEDGSLFGIQRLVHEYGENGKLAEVREEWLLEDGSWMPGVTTHYRYDDEGRLMETELDQAHLNAEKSRLIQTYEYEQRGLLSRVERTWINENGEVVFFQARELAWSLDGRLVASRELDLFSSFVYSNTGDLVLIDVSIMQKTKYPSPTRNHTFVRDPNIPAKFWYGPWNVAAGPERWIDLFGRQR